MQKINKNNMNDLTLFYKQLRKIYRETYKQSKIKIFEYVMQDMHSDRCRICTSISSYTVCERCLIFYCSVDAPREYTGESFISLYKEFMDIVKLRNEILKNALGYDFRYKECRISKISHHKDGGINNMASSESMNFDDKQVQNQRNMLELNTQRDVKGMRPNTHQKVKYTGFNNQLEPNILDKARRYLLRGIRSKYGTNVKGFKFRSKKERQLDLNFNLLSLTPGKQDLISNNGSSTKNRLRATKNRSENETLTYKNAYCINKERKLSSDHQSDFSEPCTNTVKKNTNHKTDIFKVTQALQSLIFKLKTLLNRKIAPVNSEEKTYIKNICKRIRRYLIDTYFIIELYKKIRLFNNQINTLELLLEGYLTERDYDNCFVIIDSVNTVRTEIVSLVSKIREKGNL